MMVATTPTITNNNTTSSITTIFTFIVKCKFISLPQDDTIT